MPSAPGPTSSTRFDNRVGHGDEASRRLLGRSKAKIANVECVYIADTTARTLALLSGDVDMIEAVRAPGWVDSMLQRDSTLKFDMTVPGSFNTLHVNLTRKPFDNLKVRQAMMYAIDRHAVADALKPMGGFMAGLQPAFFPAGFKTEDLPPELQLQLRSGQGEGAARRSRLPERLRLRQQLQPARGLFLDHADRAGAVARRRHAT